MVFSSSDINKGRKDFLSDLYVLVVFGFDLEIRLRMNTHRAKERCVFAYDNMSAVAALPYHVAVS